MAITHAKKVPAAFAGTVARAQVHFAMVSGIMPGNTAKEIR